MFEHSLTRKSESQAEAVRLAGCRKRLKQGLTNLFRHSRARICHTNDPRTVFAIDSNRDLPTAGHCLNCVREKINKYALKASARHGRFECSLSFDCQPNRNGLGLRDDADHASSITSDTRQIS